MNILQNIEEVDPGLNRARFDVKSIFTNFPLTETIDLCVKNLYKNQTHFYNLSKISFRKLLEMTIVNHFLPLIKNIKNNTMVFLWVSDWEPKFN